MCWLGISEASDFTHLHTQNSMQAFWCMVALLYFLCKNYVKKHQDSIVTQDVVLNLVLNFTSL
jgi:hypothetical protein